MPDEKEGEQEYNDELGQGCATLSVIGRGSDPSWVTSVGHFLLGVGHLLSVVVVGVGPIFFPQSPLRSELW